MQNHAAKRVLLLKDHRDGVSLKVSSPSDSETGIATSRWRCRRQETVSLRALPCVVHLKKEIVLELKWGRTLEHVR